MFPSRPHRPPSRAGRSARQPVRAILALLAAIAATTSLAVVAAPAASAAPKTIVSFTFDDSNADQLPAAQTLKANGMAGTFYVNSGFVNQPGYFTVANLQSLVADGHEIGGHSVTHPDLTSLPAAEAQRQVCNDRVNLANWGIQTRSFAYPFAAATTATENIVKNCGYQSARGLGDIQSRFGCTGCPFAETVPVPTASRYYTKALDQVDNTWTLADLQTAVTNAEANNGGWVQLTFHHIGGSDPLSISQAVFDQFVAWLKPRAAAQNTVVQTVGQTVGGAVKPLVNGPAVPPPTAGANGVKNASLETAGTNGLPQCWMAGGYGTNSPTFTTLTGGAQQGTKSERLVMAGYQDGDAKLLPALDLGGCSPSVTEGKTYSLRAWYTSTAVTQFAVYYRTGIGTWVYWTSSPWFAAGTTFTQAVWTTPAVPAGATGISFGLNLFSNGQLVTDSYAVYDSVGAPAVAGQQSAVVAAPSATARSAGPAVAASPTVPAPPGASIAVQPRREVRKAIPTGPSAHRARADRRGPTGPVLTQIPGPTQVKPGTPILLDEGSLSG
ncbi:polysaccharide deacetylase family protein [Pseudonocardia oroxyli]|uniref:Polysaccharide deacetylase n=1 Tax=Pseudonocardia oroxyli TaxID=366584 RepID=A0A1G7Z7W7_PSEOR|nr:polysaccharide deacetylase family protein [Pseudonocardia oroxyli]SDH04843.1 Polysaccharide deacetylase [Pseudonocardia oroxyli]